MKVGRECLCINFVFRCLACKLVMYCSPVTSDVKYGSSVVETQRVPGSLKRSQNRTFLQGFVTLSKRSGVKRSQSFRTTAEKRRREAGVAMSQEAKFLDVEDTRPRKSSGSSLHEMLSLRFGRGEKTTPKEKKPRRDPTPTRGLRSSKKQQQSAQTPQPPALTLDKIDPQTLREWEKSFDRLLRSPEGSQLFEEFLKSEFSEENIQFWRACENYRHMPEGALAKEALSIYEEFIDQEATKLVNIDHQTTKEIVESMRFPDKETFTKAQHSIYLLMARDSYVRFIKSDTFRAALNS